MVDESDTIFLPTGQRTFFFKFSSLTRICYGVVHSGLTFSCVTLSYVISNLLVHVILEHFLKLFSVCFVPLPRFLIWENYYKYVESAFPISIFIISFLELFFFFLSFSFLVTLHGMQDLSSQTKDQI